MIRDRGDSEGSSPLARGTQVVKKKGSSSFGLIPARAGNTSPVALLLCELRAHPRSRGEHEQLKRVSKSARGSSPLARGTPCELSLLVQLLGLIPARAGNTSNLL